MSDLIVFENEKKELIRNTIANQLSSSQFELFMGIASARGLDPVLGQIHASIHTDKNGNKIMTPIVGIDGFRLVAHRTREYLGRSEAVFAYDNQKFPTKVKITVYRMVCGQKAEFTATAKWDEYYPGDKKGFMWRKMPETMLEKVCEAKALRMAFPNDLSGIYAHEEMEQAEIRDVNKPTSTQEHFLPDAKPNYDGLIQAYMGLGISKEQIMDLYGLESIEDLTKEMVDDLRDVYKAAKDGSLSIQDYFNQPKGDEDVEEL